jgi:hypothetical protein
MKGTAVGRWGVNADGAEERARVAPEQSMRFSVVGRCSSTWGRGDSMARGRQHQRGSLRGGRRWCWLTSGQVFAVA